MATRTRLIQVLLFTNVPGGGGVATLPHGININDIPQAPDFVAADTSGFGIAVTATDVTVTNNNALDTTVNIWLELKHTIPRQLGAAQTLGLTPRPFVAASGSSGGNNSGWTDDGTTVRLTDAGDDVAVGFDTQLGGPFKLQVIEQDIPPSVFTEIFQVRGLATQGSFDVFTPDGTYVHAFASFLRWSTIYGATTEFAGVSGAGTVNDVALNGCFVSVTPSGGGITVTGFAPDAKMPAFPIVHILNKGTAGLTLTHEGLGSLPTNRLRLVGNAPVVIPSNGGFILTRIDVPAVGVRWMLLAVNN
jgi:hypothetical protein